MTSIRYYLRIFMIAGLIVAGGCSSEPNTTKSVPASTQPASVSRESAVTVAEDVDITYFGHSMFRVSEPGGLSVAIDPFDDSVGLPLPDVSANFVLMSHKDSDHSNAALIKGDPQVIQSLGDTLSGEMIFKGIKSFHDTVSGRIRGQNIIFKWQQGSLTFVHLGDLGQPEFSESQLAEIGDVDVLMIPVGGTFTITPQEALAIIDRLRPRIAIPMHYKTEQTKIDLQPLSDFSALTTNAISKESSITLNRDTLPEKPEIWLMDYIH